MNVYNGFYIINIFNESFITYYLNNNFYFKKCDVNNVEFPFFKIMSETTSYTIIERNELLEKNLELDLMRLNKTTNEDLLKNYIDGLKNDSIEIIT